MSFFDDVEEAPQDAPTVVRRRSPGGSRRPPSGGRRPPGRRPPGGRRPPQVEQAIRVRRAVAGAALVIAVILIVIGVHSCQVSQTNSALRDYSDRVAALIQASDQTGANVFHLLTNNGGSSNVTNVVNQLEEAHLTAANHLSQAESQSVPDQMSSAQQYLVSTLRLRADGIRNIAVELPSVYQSQASQQALTSIASEMARFYASDVLYKDYALPSIVTALRDDNIAVGGSNGEPINQGQFLPSLQWLTPSYAASVLQAHVSGTSGGKIAPGLHGHQLNSVSVAGTTLQTGSTNNVPASPAPTFTLSFANTGTNTESNVVCKVTVGSITAQQTVPSTSAGQTYSCQVALPSSPPKGSATVTATIVPVPGEKNVANNTLTFPVNFQ